MKKIQALHIASFHGNIGDNANHNGFRRKLQETLNIEVEFEEVEIREFYLSWGLRDFNTQDFVDLCNEKDLIIFGGGNFFELKWDYSYTGTTINLSHSTLNMIKKPVLFYGLGCDVGKGTNQSNIRKFGSFLDRITQSNQFLVSVRNDGSFTTLRKLYQNKYDKAVHCVADGAFFFSSKASNIPSVYEKKPMIGVNIVCDMADIRFNQTNENGLSYQLFIEGLAEVLNQFLKLNNDYHLILFPHIYSDLRAIDHLLQLIEDPIRRVRVIIAPCLTGAGAEEYIFQLYGACQLVLGMRFHSNVCSIAHGIPSIGLSSYVKIRDLYTELGIGNRIVEVNVKGFEEELLNKINETMLNQTSIVSKYEGIKNDINKRDMQFFQVLRHWAELNRII